MIDPSSLILVCLIPNPRDLEIARMLGWYRIPLRRAPKVLAVDALAFYQPGSFGKDGGRIEWTASVLGHELVTRAELLKDESDHPRARQEYFKVQLAGLEKLPRPILANKWHRITFLYTTGEHLNNARTVNDLVVQGGERSLLWHSLRERASQENRYQVTLPAAKIPEAVLAELLGIQEPREPDDWE